MSIFETVNQADPRERTETSDDQPVTTDVTAEEGMTDDLDTDDLEETDDEPLSDEEE